MVIKNISLFFLLIVGISIDQLSKYIAIQVLSDRETLTLLWGILEFSLVYNSGGFLSIMGGLPEALRFFLLTICVGIILLACLYYLFIYSGNNWRYSLPLSWVTAGGCSNLLDRLLYEEGVVDYLSVGIGSFRTGIFNLADMYILIGSFCLGYLFVGKGNLFNWGQSKIK